MFCTKHSIDRINNKDECCLRFFYQDFTYDFEIKEDENEKTIHQKCIELLLIEVCNSINILLPNIMSTIFNQT